MSPEPLERLIARMTQHGQQEAVIWRDQRFTYLWLVNEIARWSDWLNAQAIKPGSVVFLKGDYHPQLLALLLGLWQTKAIVVPYSQNSPTQEIEFLETSQAEWLIQIDAKGEASLSKTENQASHPLYSKLREVSHAGLVLFTSGTTGHAKGIVHDVARFLHKVERIQPRFQRTLAFLVLDHLGGLDTVCFSLANCGCLVVPEERTPEGILKAIETYEVNVLPTSPTFLNLVLASGVYARHALKSLKKISYGSEPMPEGVLKRYHELYPHIKLTQTYGISEIGVLRSQSQASNSLWMQVGDASCETRIVDGIFQVRSPYMMLGYLNDANAFTEDGWFITGDLVESEHGYIRIKGRASDLINVGGEKVYPLEVEEVIRELQEIADVVVYGEANPLIGQIVCAKVQPINLKYVERLPLLIKQHCLQRLPKYKVPVKIVITSEPLTTSRHKRKRN